MLTIDPKNLIVLLDKNEKAIAPEEARRLRSCFGHVKVFAVWSSTQDDYLSAVQTEYLKDKLKLLCTVSNFQEYEKDLQLIKSSLLYADEIELIMRKV